MLIGGRSGLTDDEIATAVSEGALASVPVACHAYGGSGISAAAIAGVNPARPKPN